MIGKEDMEGSAVFVIKLTRKDGDIDYMYMDTEKYVILKVKAKTIVNGSEAEVESLMSNFKKINGYIMAFTTEQRFSGQSGMTINLEEVEVNADIEDSLFTKPSGQ